MSLSYGFYDSVNHDRTYNAEQFGKMFDGVILDGIFPQIGSAFAVTATSGLNFSVATGRAWFDHTWSLLEAAETMSVSTPDLDNPRIDTVVIEINKTSRTNSLAVVTGTPSSNPVHPELAHTEYVHQYPLADIYVPARATNLGAVTDRRGTNDCPYVRIVTDIAGRYVTSLNGETGDVTGVKSFNGQTGVVVGVGSFNGRTGAITGVDSFNGRTGAITGVDSFNGLTGAIQTDMYETLVMLPPQFEDQLYTSAYTVSKRLKNPISLSGLDYIELDILVDTLHSVQNQTYPKTVSALSVELYDLDGNRISSRSTSTFDFMIMSWNQSTAPVGFVSSKILFNLHNGEEMRYTVRQYPTIYGDYKPTEAEHQKPQSFTLNRDILGEILVKISATDNMHIICNGCIVRARGVKI